MLSPQLTFLVIGAYKCGTTSLHQYLRAHPDIFVPARKEPAFFAFDGVDPGSDEARLNPAFATSVTGMAEYEALFADYAGQSALGEVSPEYMTNSRAPGRIKAHAPDAKLVAILRDPTERAYSDYLMNVRDQRETETFDRALDLQQERQAMGLANGFYVSTGFYAQQLRRYLEVFPRERLLILFADDLRTNRAGTLGMLFEFLGVDPDVTIEVEEEYNRSGIPSTRSVAAAYRARAALGPMASNIVPEGVKNRLDRLLQRRLDRPDMSEQSRARLRAIFDSDVAAVEEMTGRDLSAWRAAEVDPSVA